MIVIVCNLFGEDIFTINTSLLYSDHFLFEFLGNAKHRRFLIFLLLLNKFRRCQIIQSAIRTFSIVGLLQFANNISCILEVQKETLIGHKFIPKLKLMLSLGTSWNSFICFINRGIIPFLKPSIPLMIYSIKAF